MQIISGFGFQINLVASNTYPIGIVLTAFADDADPFDVPDIQIGDTAMGLNGDLVAWAKANPIKISLGIIPGSSDDLALGILLAANRVGKGKVGAQDIITLTGLYPNGNFTTMINGIITNGMPANSISSAGRQKSKIYQFSFENVIGI